MRLYNDYSTYLRNKYGSKVYRIGIDAGFSCPHTCAYCNEGGSRAAYADPKEPVEKQISIRMEYLKKAKGAEKFIAYFQPFTNTNAPVSQLKSVYDRILPFNEIVGLSIGTRPDCVDTDKLELISTYMDRYEVWIEYGLQSIHDRTLKAIGRGHDFNDFLAAYNDTKRRSIRVCAHVIIGLPGETREDIINTAQKLSELNVDGVKIHLLHILKGSALEKQYIAGNVRLLEREEYAEYVCDFLENLSEEIIIQRLTAQGHGDHHVAPQWALDKIGTIMQIDETMRRRGSRQGMKI